MYTALYRRFRPETFDKLIGQEHIIRTLVNQIEGGRIGHAYLFTGSRGTGKTSAAKIFARAVNCEKPVSGSPCRKCAACGALSEPNNLDIIEIDAASNNRVDEIRELREKVKYAPVSGRYKVYIIDEVHMLTDSAFNALLKTLEEPPPYVIFILATTEVHKLPATILSRCMRFDFRLVPQKEIARTLEDIFKDIKKPYDKEAVNAIAAAAEGSVRDALSIADMCVSYTDKKLTAGDVLAVLGAADIGKQFQLAEAVLCGDAGAVLTIINELISDGKAGNILAKDMAAHFRNLLVAKTCGKSAAEILPLPPEILKRFEKQAENAAFEKLYECAESLAKLDAELRFSLSPRILLEALCLKLCKGPAPTAAAAAASPAQQRQSREPDSPQGGEALKIWGQVVTALRKNGGNFLYAAACEKTSVYISEGFLVLRLKDQSEYELFGKPMNVSVINGILEDLGQKLSFKAENLPAKTAAEDEFKRVKELGGDAVRFTK